MHEVVIVLLNGIKKGVPRTNSIRVPTVCNERGKLALPLAQAVQRRGLVGGVERFKMIAHGDHNIRDPVRNWRGGPAQVGRQPQIECPNHVRILQIIPGNRHSEPPAAGYFVTFVGVFASGHLPS